ncbi:hypothetical protein [Novosphingobium rosa]|uniref:hypothetical protein n=1 Tax=Novosphingobium rosa TaxID=76978 RepID=UPI0012EDB8A8|nr:hypothetical protein [Novosphingobium rosa]
MRYFRPTAKMVDTPTDTPHSSDAPFGVRPISQEPIQPGHGSSGMPLARFTSKLDPLFWELWSDFSADCRRIGAQNHRNKPVLLPTLPLAQAYLVDDQFGKYLEARDFFSGCPNLLRHD